MKRAPRRAVVLLLTLGFIAIITALVLYGVTLSKKSFDQVTSIEADNQFYVAFSDMLALVKRLRENRDLNDTEKLSFLLDEFSLPPITEPKSGITIGFIPETYMNRLNLNAILKRLVQSDEKESDGQETLLLVPLERFFRFYEISDIPLLLDIMKDTIDPDLIERSGYSEIADENFDFRQGRIYSFDHLKQIFDRYYRISRDERIYKIDEEDFTKDFYFGDSDAMGLLDCERLEPAVSIPGEPPGVVELLTGEATIQMDYCGYFKSRYPALAKLFLIDSYGHYQTIEKNTTKRKYLIKCILTLDTAYYKRDVAFDYEFESAGISNIEKDIHE